jgi:hypothetical protein
LLWKDWVIGLILIQMAIITVLPKDVDAKGELSQTKAFAKPRMILLPES